MSRDGYLPPGFTEKDVDEAAPGYWDEPELRDIYRTALDGLGYDEYCIQCTVERMIEKGCKAEVMDLFDKLIERFRLDAFK